MKQKKYKIIACGLVLDELQLPATSSIDIQELDAGLHLSSEKLHEALQSSIDMARNDYEAIVLGFGLCAMALIGLQAKDCPIYIPRTDDCIGLLLGSQNSYDTLRRENPGTYYLSKGWINRKITVFDDFHRLSKLYGDEQAHRMIKLVLKGYNRLVYIYAHGETRDKYGDHAQKMANTYGLEFKEVQGSYRFLEKIINGPHDEEFITIEPGSTLNYLDFKDRPTGQGMPFSKSHLYPGYH